MATKTAEKSMAKSAKPKNDKTAARRSKPAGKPGGKVRKPAVAAKAKPGAAKPVSKPKKAAAQAKPPLKKAPPPKPAKKTEIKPAAKKPEPPKKGVQPAKDAAAKPSKIPEKAAKESAKKSPLSKAALKDAAAKKKPEIPAKKKKLMVGQKPRSSKPSESANFTLPLHVQKASPSVNESPVKASPASAEAKMDFKVNDHIVYPAHGVGRIVGVEKQVIAGITNELFLIDFEQEKMKLRVPTAKAKAVGMRRLSDPAQIKKAIEMLKGRARVKRTMWSRRAQEYEAKINSGDINSVAEVVRDLFRASDQPEQSYSERQLFEAALDRMAREVAAVNKTDLAAAIAALEAALSQKRAA